MKKDVNELCESLKEVLDTRLNIKKVDNETGVMSGFIDGIEFALLYRPKSGLRFFTEPDKEELISEIRRILYRAINFREYVGYDLKNGDNWYSVLEWSFIDPMGLAYNLEHKKTKYEVKNVNSYDGGLTVSYSILANKDRIFVPLPKEQQLTEKSLIDLERKVAKSARIHDAEAALSVLYASRSLPCTGESNTIDDEEKRESYTKK